MNHPHCSLLRLLPFAVAVLLFSTVQAQARRRIPKLYTYGPATSEMGPVKKDALQKLDPATRAEIEAGHYDTVGFHYTHFGLFWLDIWSWGGEYVVYNEATDDGGTITPAMAATLLGIEESKLGKPLSYHIPWGLVVIVGLMALKIVPRLMAKKRQARESARFSSGPAWTPQPPGYSPPVAPPSGYAPPAPPQGGQGPPPVPPPLPPDQQ
jgi:hypothetical protein